MDDKHESLSDQLLRGLGSAIADIREKVIEEPLYGRTLHGKGDMGQAHDSEPGAGFGSVTRTIEAGAHWPHAVEPSREAATQERDTEPDKGMER
jgi:hypothetical protein